MLHRTGKTGPSSVQPEKMRPLSCDAGATDTHILKAPYGAEAKGVTSKPLNQHFPADSERHGCALAEP